MKTRKLASTFVALIVGLTSFVLFAGALDQGHGHGHDQDEQGEGHGKGHEKKEHGRYYSDHNRDEIRGWYHEHESNLPPGLAKRDELPPGLERQLRIRGELPPGLRREIQPCPPEIVRYLPPPPPDAEHVIIGGHIVLMNRKTFVVLDIIHLFR